MSDFNLGETLSTKNLPLKANQNQPRETLKLSIKESPATEENPKVESSGSSEGALPDFDNAPLPDDEITEAAPPVGEGADGKITPSGKITYEIFDDGFCKAFQLGGHLSGLNTLVQAAEQPARPDATRAMYDIILDTPALHFLITPSSLWMQRALAIGMFVVPVGLGVSQELAAKQAARMPAKADAATAKNEEADMRAALKGKKHD